MLYLPTIIYYIIVVWYVRFYIRYNLLSQYLIVGCCTSVQRTVFLNSEYLAYTYVITNNIVLKFIYFVRNRTYSNNAY